LGQLEQLISIAEGYKEKIEKMIEEKLNMEEYYLKQISQLREENKTLLDKCQNFEEIEQKYLDVKSSLDECYEESSYYHGLLFEKHNETTLALTNYNALVQHAEVKLLEEQEKIKKKEEKQQLELKMNEEKINQLSSENENLKRILGENIDKSKTYMETLERLRSTINGEPVPPSNTSQKPRLSLPGDGTKTQRSLRNNDTRMPRKSMEGGTRIPRKSMEGGQTRTLRTGTGTGTGTGTRGGRR